MAKGELHTDHPLLKLRGQRVGRYGLHIEAWPGRFVGQAEFVLYLKGVEGEMSKRPVVEGLYGRTRIPGSQADMERGILDVILGFVAEFGSTRVELRGSELEEAIVGAICETIQDTWSAMMYLAYGWKTLKQIQELRHPLHVTDEGHLLFTHGFRGGWKDYYYSEGWWEGPIKLKAERPPTPEYRSLWDAENARVLLDFLKRPLAEGDLQFQEEGVADMVTLPILNFEQIARSRALLILQELGLGNADLIDERGRILSIYPPPGSVGKLSAEELAGVVVKAAEVR
ncbi:MAG: DUF1122 family protein [Candidatus Methylomirabilales bacterium]